MMKVVSGAIGDKSPAVRKSYAVAAGYVAHLCTDNTLIKFINHLKKLYCESDSEPRSIAGITILEISRHASDELKRIYVEALPVAYFGMNDEDKGISKVWTEVWEENTAGAYQSLFMTIVYVIYRLITLYLCRLYGIS
jgi:proteasome component ECM29